MAGMSYKQQAFLQSLLETKVIPFELFERVSALDYNTITVREACSLIDTLIKQPKKGLPESDVNGNNIPKEPAGEGFYFYNNEVYHVVKSKKGNNYAKQLIHVGNKGRWDYVKGMVNSLNVSHLISLDEAKKFGRNHGFCMVCGATLTDPVSVTNGIGPICSQRF